MLYDDLQGVYVISTKKLHTKMVLQENCSGPCAKWFYLYIKIFVLHLTYVTFGFTTFLYVEEGLSPLQCIPDITEATSWMARIAKNETDLQIRWRYKIQEQIERALNESVKFTQVKEEYRGIVDRLTRIVEKNMEVNKSGYPDVNRDVHILSTCWDWVTFPFVTMTTIGKLKGVYVGGIISLSWHNTNGQLQQTDFWSQ